MRWAIALALLTACGEAVDTADLPSIDGYDSWHRVDVEGEAPGHGDTYRIIYANDAARGYTGGGEYPVGAVIVKEIRGAGGAEQPIEYLAIMRKLDRDADAPTARGWLYTRTDAVGQDETHFDYCYAACHAQAPLDGTFYDYGR